MFQHLLASFTHHLLPVRCAETWFDLSQASPVSKIGQLTAVGLLILYTVVIVVFFNGFIEVLLKFPKNKKDALPGTDETEGVSILRPLKGIDPEMETCLESSFVQEYPSDKFELIFCIAEANDPAIPLVTKLCKKYSHINTSILVGNDHYGPNPKINNLAKGYSAARFDIVWVLDSNVQVFPKTLRKAVTALHNSLDNGRKTSRRVKLVHHLPLAVAIDPSSPSTAGAHCDEMFMMTAHSKFYVSINKVSLRPCVNGKSNLYRRSDLDYAVKVIGEGFVASEDGKSGKIGNDAAFYSQEPFNGLKLFARYIGEDNMIGIALWDSCESRTGMTGDVVVQPLGGNNSIKDYCQRRIRWLRARKYMVLTATLLEPATESILSGLYGTFAISNLFLGCRFKTSIFVAHMLIWFFVDRYQYLILYELSGKTSKRLSEFARYWLIRELLALPIWIVAMCGHKIDWRGALFKINRDLSAEEL